VILLSNNWYTLFVKTGEEDNVKKRLEYRFDDQFRFIVPKRKLKERKNGKWNDVIRLLFPSYILFEGELDIREIERFRDVPNLYRLLCSNGLPLRIEMQEIETIKKLTSNGEIIGTSLIISENSVVKVIDGPLTSLEGRILRIDKRKQRAKVSLNFCGEQKCVDLNIEVLEKV
jgi:transcription termination/antitermination protein NusG